MGRSPKNRRLSKSTKDTTHQERTLSSANPYVVAAVCGLLVLAVFLVFGQTLQHEFVNYDDNLHVYENASLTQGLTLRGIVWAFTTFHANLWHPITWLSYLTDFQLYGLKPWGYHLTNVLLHAASTVLLFLALRRMTAQFWPSAFVAAVFAIHPLHVESVAWVAERKDVLSGLFFMLTLNAYVSYVRRPFSIGWYLLVMALFALGLMAKPVMVTLPFLLLLLDYWPLRRMNGMTTDGSAAPRGFSIPWRLLIEKIPLLALALAFCVVTPIAEAEAVASSEVMPISWRIANAPVAYVAYMAKLFYPVDLSIPYLYLRGGPPLGEVLGSLLLLTGISTTALIYWRKLPYLFVGWFWYLGTLVPMIGFVQVGSHSMADRFTYLTQIGLYIMVAWGAAQIVDSRPNRQKICGVLSAVVLLGLLSCSRQQASYWRDSETLWRHTLACDSQNIIAHENLGWFLVNHGRFQEALPHYQQVLKLGSDSADVYNNYGLILFKLGRFDEAVDSYQKALGIKPDDVEVLNNLGLALVQQGRVGEAIVQYQKALKINPNCAEGHNNLGSALAKLGQFEEAVSHFETALKLKPDYAECHDNYGLALAGHGRINDSIAHFEKAVDIQPNYAEGYNNLGMALSRCSRNNESITQFKKALEIKPDFAEAHNNLGMELVRRGRIDESIDHFRMALRINPQLAVAQKNLNIALFLKDKEKKGRGSFSLPKR